MVRRRLLTTLCVLIAVIAAARLALHAYGRGWFVTARSAVALASELRNRVFAPAGSGPFPAVVELHGCGGDPDHQRDWGEFFAHNGFLALAVDSLSGRGLAPEAVCGGRALLPAERTADALVSLDVARRDPRVEPERVVMVGWSHGASTLIELLEADPPRERLPSLLPTEPALGLEGLAGVVLLYPYCGFGTRSEVWPSDVPVLMLLAERDTIAKPVACLDLVARLRAAGKPVETVVYPGVSHGFDFRILPPGSPLAPPHPEMASRAQQDVLAFLRRVVQMEAPGVSQQQEE